jgi:hypothetical protein
VLFSFLEQYLKRLEGPVAVQVWPRVMQLAKDVSVTSRDAKLQAYAMLRYVPIWTESGGSILILLSVVYPSSQNTQSRRVAWMTSAFDENFR